MKSIAIRRYSWFVNLMKALPAGVLLTIGFTVAWLILPLKKRTGLS